jgi:hypothetical protein
MTQLAATDADFTWSWRDAREPNPWLARLIDGA